ncbi:MAG: NEW3 domain-containing protein, partial [Anaerolineales bacterium]|nr:NEW3 domain-containing protein [Anaerolineales bacterium]
TFKSAGQELTSLPIRAGQTENVDIEVRPARQTPAGDYPIVVRVESEQISDEVKLTAAVTGQFDLTLTAPDGRLSGRAIAGQETPLELIVRNSGTAPANEVRLEASAPAQWSVTFDPEIIPELAPDSEVQVKANIKPPDKAIAGDYMVTLRAVPAGGSLESSEFRITVETSTWWGIVGLALIAAALGVVALAVARFGRR